MTIQNEQDLQQLRTVGQIVASILSAMGKSLEIGMTTAELDVIGRDLLERHDAVSAPRSTYNFPGYTCISINEEAAHGVPGDRTINAGDLVNIDVSAMKNGYYADTGGTFVVPPSNYIKDKLVASTQLALNHACQRAGSGRRLNEIGKAIQNVARKKGFTVIRNLCSHGIGHQLHDEPREIPGYYEPKDLRTLHKGLVITIEPFLSTKSKTVSEQSDGWTLAGQAGNLSAQFEHTLVITDGKPLIMTCA